MDKKNLVLISDGSGSCIDSFISTGLYNIKLLVIPYKKDIVKLKEKYGESIENIVYFIPDTNEEFQNEFAANYNLTYDEIEKYRPAQLKCYRYNTRFVNDDNTNNCIYYTALKFFLNFFNSNKIDMVFSKIIEHGSISDSLIFEIAKMNNIPVYIFTMNTGFIDTYINSVLLFNTKKFIDLSSVDGRDLDYEKLLNTLNGNYSSNALVRLPFSKLIKKFVSKKNKSFFDCVKWFYNNKIKYGFKSFKYFHTEDLYKIREETSLGQIFKGYLHLKKIKRFYKKNVSSVDFNDNFIFYPLHMEPEASHMVRATMNCQLYIIEQISRLLPDGYFLYIKEHPDQFMAVQESKYYYKSIMNFRNIDFYKRISKLKNVKIIDAYYPSSSLIDKSLAVTTITGSALFEAVRKNKATIVFGNGTTFLENLNDVFSINDADSLKKAINSVINGFRPDYSDLNENVNKYTFCAKNEQYYYSNNLFESIFKLLYSLS